MKDLISSREVRSLIELRMCIAFESDRASQRAVFEKENKRYKAAKEWREQRDQDEASLVNTFQTQEEYQTFRKLFNLMVHGEEMP